MNQDRKLWKTLNISYLINYQYFSNLKQNKCENEDKHMNRWRPRKYVDDRFYPHLNLKKKKKKLVITHIQLMK